MHLSEQQSTHLRLRLQLSCHKLSWAASRARQWPRQRAQRWAAWRLKGNDWQMRPHCQKTKGKKCPCHHYQQQHRQLLSKLLHLLFLRQLLLQLQQQQPKHPLCHQQQLRELLQQHLQQRLQQLSRQLLLTPHQHLTHQLHKHSSQPRLPHSCHQHWGWQLSETLEQLPSTERQHLCMLHQQDSPGRVTHV